jgi:hypothetical protein
LADILGTKIWRSSDNGQTWAMQFSDITTVDLAATNHRLGARSPNSVLVGGAGKVLCNHHQWYCVVRLYLPSRQHYH